MSQYKGPIKERHNVQQILATHRLYFLMWTLFQVSNLAFGLMSTKSSALVAIHSILMALTPINICITFFKTDYYQLIDLHQVEPKENTANHSLLDDIILNSLPPELEKKVGHERHPSRNADTMDKMNKHWENENNTKETMRNNILVSIIKGFEDIYKGGKEHGSNKNISGLEIEDPNIKVEKPPLFRRIVLYLLGKEEANAENYEEEGNRSALLGHPDVLKKVSVMSQTEIDKDIKFEKLSTLKKPKQYLSARAKFNDSSDNEFEFTELSPKIFKNIRRIHNIDDHMVRSIFSSSNIQNLDITLSQGKGGSFFIKPIVGGRMLMKSITKPEYEIIQNFISDYYCYLLMNPNTYLCPILGVYKIKFNKNSSAPPIAFILMRNVLNIDVEDLKDNDKVYCFDLKGSVHGRRTLENPVEILNFEENYNFHKNLILKDIDFFQSFRKLDITTIQAERIISQIQEDSTFLSQHNFMDYSLLVYIVIKPYEEVKSNLQVRSEAREMEIDKFKSIDMQSRVLPDKINNSSIPNIPTFNQVPSRNTI